MADDEDIISTLPDVILCHILSFLQTKQYVTTSILSKRWNNLWRSVPALNLGPIDLADPDAYHRFIDFVNSFLRSLDLALPVNTFNLYFLCNSYVVQYPYGVRYPQCHMESITKWVNFVVQRGVQEIDLYVGMVSSFNKLPISILTCTTLVVLKIDSFSLAEGFSPVNLPSLPSLKTLHLKYISFPKHRDFMLFLAGCPILENLLTSDVLFDFTVSLTCDEWKSFSLTNLTTADIDGYRNQYREHFPLKVVHNVSSLRLEVGQLDYLHDFIPTFHNLTKLDFVCCSLRNNWKFVVELLKHCPKLQKLRLHEAELAEEYMYFWPNDNNDDDENWVDPDFVPQCLSLHLSTCYFSTFFGLCGTKLMLAKYILKNAKVLQKMKIWNSGETQIKEQLSSCPKASAICKLTVYDVSDDEMCSDDDML